MNSPRWIGIGVLLVVAAVVLWWLSQPPPRVEQPLPMPVQDEAAPAASSAAGQGFAGQALEYRRDIKPILDHRCVVCHGCYDAPCQLKLDSPAGLLRGASKEPVYDGTRLMAAAPTRLYLDAELTAEWRARGFFPVLNEGDPRPETNLADSLLYRTLILKKAHPLPPGELPPSLDTSSGYQAQCPQPDQFEAWARRNPLAGMPYGLPGLSDEELRRIERWLAGGAPMAPAPALEPPLRQQVAVWERFLNGDDAKSQLMARYLYEHWFLADLYFDLPQPVSPETDRSAEAAAGPQRFFRLVRSRTPPGQRIVTIATRRPYDDPEAARVYYRLQPLSSSRLAKTHLPYALGERRLQRLRQLFLAPDYRVEALPGYEPELAANPFAVFAAIPVRSRYRFLLDDAEFTIANFVKGPVCRGQLALNVIDDRFWLLFADPDTEPMVDGDFLARVSGNLRLPGELDPTAGMAALPAAWQGYARQQGAYLSAKAEHLHSHFGAPGAVTLDLLWDGGDGLVPDAGRNPNAALTILRHFDSASVVRGLVGEVPKTAWVVDYPMLERIHYLLVAGFDVYGNAGHQLLTRLYMDFLRMEGEYNFLHFLPLSLREAERARWYQGLGASARDRVYREVPRYRTESGVHYRSDDLKAEFFALMRRRLGGALEQRYTLHGDWPPAVQAQLEQLAALRGRAASWLPEVAFLRLVRKGAPDEVFTVLRDSDHSNLAVLMLERQRRRPERDRLTVVPGFIGAYPNAFWVVTEEELPQLVRAAAQLSSAADYRLLMRRFGVLRSDPRFWRHSDWLHREFRSREPLGWGLFDYNRYQ